jgi:hypothetical protein
LQGVSTKVGEGRGVFVGGAGVAVEVGVGAGVSVIAGAIGKVALGSTVGVS